MVRNAGRTASRRNSTSKRKKTVQDKDCADDMLTIGIIQENPNIEDEDNMNDEDDKSDEDMDTNANSPSSRGDRRPSEESPPPSKTARMNNVETSFGTSPATTKRPSPGKNTNGHGSSPRPEMVTPTADENTVATVGEYHKQLIDAGEVASIEQYKNTLARILRKDIFPSVKFLPRRGPREQESVVMRFVAEKVGMPLKLLQDSANFKWYMTLRSSLVEHLRCRRNTVVDAMKKKAVGKIIAWPC